MANKQDNTEGKIIAVEEALGKTEQFIEKNQKKIKETILEIISHVFSRIFFAILFTILLLFFIVFIHLFLLYFSRIERLFDTLCHFYLIHFFC